VVIVHGMGEQRSGDALNGFINTGVRADESGRGCSARDRTR
jgi:hypothetical protein